MDILVMWIVISAAAAVIDVVTSSFFFGGFTVGGVAALFAQLGGSSFMNQVIIFALVSAVAITVEFVWFRKKVKKSIPKTPKMEEEYIGRIFTADEDIGFRGRIKFEGIYWTVENDGDRIEKGQKAKIVGISGNKLLVKKVREE